MKVATYNIHYGVGLDGNFDLVRILAPVRNADIIALQEVEVGWDRSANSDQPSAILKMLPEFEAAWGPTVDVRKSFNSGTTDRRQFGNMLLSRYPIISIRNLLFPKYGAFHHLEMQRGALEILVDTPLGLLRVYSTHLCNLSEVQRIRQTEILLDHHNRACDEGPLISGFHSDATWTSEQSLPDMPREAIILGDMNFTPDSAAYEHFVGEYSSRFGHMTRRGGFVDAWTAKTDMAQAPSAESSGATSVGLTARRIDYCFVSSSLSKQISSVAVETTATGSDHFPLIVDFKGSRGD